MLTLYHCPNARSFRALWCITEMGMERDLKLITMHFPPRVFHRPFLKENVLGTIPLLVDSNGDVRMTESCGIPVYLVNKYGPTPLCVKPDEPDYGSYLNWIAHADATLTFPQTVVLRYTLQEAGRADKAAEDYGNWYIARLRLLDNTLSDGRQFLCSGRFTIADICVSWALTLGIQFGFDERYTPQTKAYMERMTERPGWKLAERLQEGSYAKFTEEFGPPKMPERKPKGKSQLKSQL